MKLSVSFLLLLTSLFSVQLSAQSTWSGIYDMMQAKCSGCHGGASPSGNLDLSGSSSAVYNALVNQVPTNPAAVAKGNLLVDPGYPEKSFLLRKCATPGWDSWPEYTLDVAEGNTMPTSPQPTLADAEIEMIRQWILFGASETDSVVDSTLIVDFYNGKGLPKLAPPPPPTAGEGFQLRLGSFFLEPQGEVEYYKKQKLEFPADLEVTSIEVFFNSESHHFILHKFIDNGDQDFGEGLRDIEDGEASTFQSDIVAAWQNPDPIHLPATTAYFWKGNDVLDLNYHLLNYSLDSILAADVYLNIYTQPQGVAAQEMKSQLIPIDWFSVFIGGPVGPSLIIPPTGQPIRFQENFFVPQPGMNWHIWALGTHTHARGTDFDIYRRQPNGTRGVQLYEGFYNQDYTFNQGFYDWQHPPVRSFDPLYELPIMEGLIFEAEYVNNTPDTLRWGPTTQDEMMLISVQFTEAALTGREVAAPAEAAWLQTAPNPFRDQTCIAFYLEAAQEVHLELLDLMGRPLRTLAKGPHGPGKHEIIFHAQNLPRGIYLLQLTYKDQSFTQKIVHWE